MSCPCDQQLVLLALQRRTVTGFFAARLFSGVTGPMMDKAGDEVVVIVVVIDEMEDDRDVVEVQYVAAAKKSSRAPVSGVEGAEEVVDLKDASSMMAWVCAGVIRPFVKRDSVALRKYSSEEEEVVVVVVVTILMTEPALGALDLRVNRRVNLCVREDDAFDADFSRGGFGSLGAW